MNAPKPSRGITPGLPTNSGSFKASEKSDAGVSLSATVTESGVVAGYAGHSFLPDVEEARRVYYSAVDDFEAAEAAPGTDYEIRQDLNARRRIAAVRYAMTPEGRQDLEAAGDRGSVMAGMLAERRTKEAADRGIGFDAQPTSIASARRAMPEGARVEIVYLAGQRTSEEADIRTVTKQNDREMVTVRDGEDKSQGVHNTWAKRSAFTDSSGNTILADEYGMPYVAYVPLG